MFGADRWQKAFYRTALPLGSCVALREAVRPLATALAVDLSSSEFKPDQWLLQLTCNVAPAAEVLRQWRDVDPVELQDVLTQWLQGVPAADINAAYRDTWQTVQFDLDKLIPWVLTSVVEFLAAELNDDSVRDQLHRRLEIFRLRYGVPRGDLCELVRRGCDRVRVVELADEHAQLPEWDQLNEDVEAFVLRRLAEEEEEEEPFCSRKPKTMPTGCSRSESSDPAASEPFRRFRSTWRAAANDAHVSGGRIRAGAGDPGSFGGLRGGAKRGANASEHWRTPVDPATL